MTCNDEIPDDFVNYHMCATLDGDFNLMIFPPLPNLMYANTNCIIKQSTYINIVLLVKPNVHQFAYVFQYAKHNVHQIYSLNK